MPAEITLAQVAEHLARLEIGCRKCDRYGRLRVTRLIDEYGAEQGLGRLLELLAADCPRQQATSIYIAAARIIHNCRPSSVRGWETRPSQTARCGGATARANRSATWYRRRY